MFSSVEDEEKKKSVESKFVSFRLVYIEEKHAGTSIAVARTISNENTKNKLKMKWDSDEMRLDLIVKSMHAEELYFWSDTLYLWRSIY